MSKVPLIGGHDEPMAGLTMLRATREGIRYIFNTSGWM
jgi:hypothetical protein